MGFTKKTNVAKFENLARIHQKVWENCLLITSENSNFGKNGEFGKNLSKVWQKLKHDKRRMSLIVGSYEKTIFCETNHEFSEKSIKGLTKYK